MAEQKDEQSSVLTAIFTRDMLDSWGDSPDFVKYVSELTSYGVERLSRETDHLKEEKLSVDKQTEDLAFNNYKTFIQTAECSHDIYKDFQIIESNLGSLLEKLPRFSEDCQGFLEATHTINQRRRSNTLTLQKHTQLLEILEVPQLMHTCVRNNYYDEALELSAYVRRMEKKYGNIPIIKSICDEVKKFSQLLLAQLLQQLRGDLQLPACLRVIGFLRHMDIFTEAELRLKFLQTRDSWFQSIISNIPRPDAYTHITKVIEASRVHLFDVITQYRAIFTDDEQYGATELSNEPRRSQLLQCWIHSKVEQFLDILREDLDEGVSGRLDSLLGQCMYFGLSFSRVGCDFRGLIADVFQNAARRTFEAAANNALETYERNMETYTLVLRSSQSLNMLSSDIVGLSPPTSLLQFTPLALLCNDILTAFNELRVCAPINISPYVVKTLEKCLSGVAGCIMNFHRMENRSFTDEETLAFNKMCHVFSNDLLRYLNICLESIFPPQHIYKALGIPISSTKRESDDSVTRLYSINIPLIIELLTEFLPKPEPVGADPVSFSIDDTEDIGAGDRDTEDIGAVDRDTKGTGAADRDSEDAERVDRDGLNLEGVELAQQSDPTSPDIADAELTSPDIADPDPALQDHGQSEPLQSKSSNIDRAALLDSSQNPLAETIVGSDAAPESCGGNHLPDVGDFKAKKAD